MVVAKFEALFCYWCEGNGEYHYRLWSRERNLKLKQAAHNKLNHSVAGAGGNSVQ
jgi:hypothetical protein